MPFTSCVGWWWRDTESIHSLLFLPAYLKLFIFHLALVDAFCLMELLLSLGLDKLSWKHLTFENSNFCQCQECAQYDDKFPLAILKRRLLPYWNDNSVTFILFALKVLMLRGFVSRQNYWWTQGLLWDILLSDHF